MTKSTPPTPDTAAAVDATDEAETILQPVEEAVAPPADEATLLAQIEAVLMSIERPIASARLAETLGVESSKPINDGVKKLNEHYETTGRSFRVEQVAGGYQMLTLPGFKEIIARLHRTKDDNKLSPAALETLAIIAYKQPILRIDIEAIRGVSTGEVVRTLMERHLVKIVGRAEELGRPMLYGTTKTFLETFGLANLKDLPSAQELAKP